MIAAFGVGGFVLTAYREVVHDCSKRLARPTLYTRHQLWGLRPHRSRSLRSFRAGGPEVTPRIHLAAMGVMLWGTIGFVNAGFVYADFYGRYDNFQGPTQSRDARNDCGFALGYSILAGPVAWVETPFETGFYYAGWKLPCSP